MNALSTLTTASSLREVRAAVFEVVVRGLAAQSWLQSMDSNGGCCWDSTDRKRRCAVGHLLVSVEKIPSVESGRQTVVRAFDYVVPELKAWANVGQRNGELVSILVNFQNMHDLTPDQAEMRMKFKEYGEAYSLKWPEGVE